MNNKEIFLSVVVPVYNEEGTVSHLHQEVLQVCKKIEQPYEIIFVNDGSTDGTFKILKSLHPIKIISFRRNFGQTAALDAGIKNARGRFIATLDGDGQNDPVDIGRLLEKLKEDRLDVVSGWRKKRHDSFSKRISSKLAAAMRRALIDDGIHDSGCTLKIYKKECFQHVDLVGEMHRFIPALLKIKGFKVGELEVNHRARTAGKTKYSWARGLKGILDMFSVWFWKKYANRPLHLFGTIGIVLIVISILSGSWAIYLKIFYRVDLSDTVLTILSMFGFLIGIQFFVFGLLADIMSKTYFSSTKDTIYDIKEVVERKDE